MYPSIFTFFIIKIQGSLGCAVPTLTLKDTEKGTSGEKSLKRKRFLELDCMQRKGLNVEIDLKVSVTLIKKN